MRSSTTSSGPVVPVAPGTPSYGVIREPIRKPRSGISSASAQCSHGKSACGSPSPAVTVVSGVCRMQKVVADEAVRLLEVHAVRADFPRPPGRGHELLPGLFDLGGRHGHAVREPVAGVDVHRGLEHRIAQAARVAELEDDEGVTVDPADLLDELPGALERCARGSSIRLDRACVRVVTSIDSMWMIPGLPRASAEYFAERVLGRAAVGVAVVALCRLVHDSVGRRLVSNADRPPEPFDTHLPTLLFA